MPFQSYKIMHGQTRGKKPSGFLSIFSNDRMDDENEVVTLKEVGQFKGIVSVHNEEEKEQHNKLKQEYLAKIAELLE